MQMDKPSSKESDAALDHELKFLAALAEARAEISIQFASVLPVSEIELGHIYFEDSEEVSHTWRLTEKRDWIDIEWWRIRRNQTKRIDVSIRCRDFLCGLMLARRSKHKLCITLRYLEGNPKPHPLKGYVLPIALIIAESFAAEYGIRQVCVSRPEKELISDYESRGYELNDADKRRRDRKGKPRAKLLTKHI